MKKALIVVTVLVALFAVLVAFWGKPGVGDVVVANDPGAGCFSRDALVRFMGLVKAGKSDTLNAELMYTGKCLKLPLATPLTVDAVDGDYLQVRFDTDVKLWTYWTYVSIKG